MSYAVGVDIGGTKTAIGIVNGNGIVVSEKRIPTNLDISAVEMIGQIAAVIVELLREVNLNETDLMGIGIGSPGPLDAKRGIITCPPNLPHWINVDLVQELKKTFSVPILLENDANVAALGEKWLGAAKENHHFIYLTISTGIGAGLYLDGKLLSGASGNAGDIGHMVVNPAVGTCPCGQKGCLEWVASGTAISRRASEALQREVTTQEAFQLYENKDPKITQLIEEIFKDLGVSCVTLINLFDPEKIVIGGGVSKVGEPLFRSIRQYVQQYALNPSGRKTEIVPAQLQENAGLIGAASLIFLSDPKLIASTRL